MNRETYPASQSPLQGDISGPAGAQSVRVVGIQSIPVDPTTPTDQEFLKYDATLGEWSPELPGNVSITFGTFLSTSGEIISRGVWVSDDYDFSCNGIGFEVLLNWTHGFAFNCYIDGTGVPGTET